MTVLPAGLGNRNYRLFVGGQSLSVLGSEFTTVAMAWEVYQLTDAPLDIGLIGLARAIPQMGLLLFGGLLADAFDRRRLMIAVQAGQFAVSALLAVLSGVGAVTPLTLFLASGVFGVFTALETPSRQAFIPNIVSRDALSSALALNNALRKVGSVAGPSLGGIVLAFASPAWCYGVTAASWLALLGALALISSSPQPAAHRGAISFSSLRAGVEFVVTHPVILCIMALDFGATLFAAPNALFPVYARDILQVGAAGLGVLYAASSLGAIVGGICMSMMGRIRRAGLGVLLGVAIYGLATALFALSPALWPSALLLAISGIGNTISAVLRWTIVQLLSPDPLRGRVSAVSSIFTSGGPRLGDFRAGLVAQFWGAGASALTGGLATLVLVLAVAMVPGVRRFRLEPGVPRGEAGEPTVPMAVSRKPQTS